MSADENKTVTALNPTEFFDSIGNKVEGYSGATNGATTEEEEYRPVEEIESLCMNCGENVSRLTRPTQYPSALEPNSQY